MDDKLAVNERKNRVKKTVAGIKRDGSTFWNSVHKFMGQARENQQKNLYGSSVSQKWQKHCMASQSRNKQQQQQQHTETKGSQSTKRPNNRSYHVWNKGHAIVWNTSAKCCITASSAHFISAKSGYSIRHWLSRDGTSIFKRFSFHFILVGQKCSLSV